MRRLNNDVMNYEQWKKKNAKKFQRREKRKSKKKDQSQLINDFLKEISS